MAALRKFPDELRQRAIRMAIDARRDPTARTGAIKRVAGQLGINPETLRGWVMQAEVDAGDRPGVSSDEAARIAALKSENRELRRANEMAVSRGQRNSSASFSDGVMNCKVSRGRPLRESWIASSSSLVTSLRSTPLGRY